MSSLNIAFDAKRIFLNKSGLGNYSRWLVKGLINEYPNNQYHLFTTAISDYQKDFIGDNIHTHLPLTLFKGFWRSKTIKKDLVKAKIDIYHGLSNELPYGIEKTNIKTVVTIHDLIFKIYPDNYHPIDRLIYDRKFKNACLKAHKIIAPSHHTKQSIINFYGITSNKIEVIYQDSSSLYYRSVNELDLINIKERFELSAPFFMNVGNLGGRKNQLNLVKAFASVAHNIQHNLLLIGKAGNDSMAIAEIIKNSNLNHRIKILDSVSDNELFHLYHASYATVYPSYYEGFGIPILESYRCGKPVITSAGSSLEEISGKASIICNPNSVEDIADKLVQITNSDIYFKLKALIPLELERFNPKSLMAQYSKIYGEL